MKYIINDNGLNREMTANEAAAYEQSAAQIQADLDKANEKATAALETRKAPMRRIGLTEQEINTVLGL